MATINKGRFTAVLESDQELVVFVIGMRINQLWNVRKWAPVVKAMAVMLGELHRDRSLGLLGSPKTFVSGRTILLVQYWRSFAQLEQYARAGENLHLPAWRRFNKLVRDNGSVGIYHETYQVNTSNIENIYGNMPAFGLGLVGDLQPVRAGRQSAGARMGVKADVDLPVEPY
jgi:hypothetical protein